MKELYAIDKSTLVAIGSAVREKKNSTEAIPVKDLASAISSISVGGESERYVIRAGNYTDANNTTGNYDYLPYPSYNLSADINGSLTIDGVSIGSFTKVRISGYGIAMEEDKFPEGAPYPYVDFYNGDQHINTIDVSYIADTSVELSISEDAEVSVLFCLAFKGLFRKN